MLLLSFLLTFFTLKWLIKRITGAFIQCVTEVFTQIERNVGVVWHAWACFEGSLVRVDLKEKNKCLHSLQTKKATFS